MVRGRGGLIIGGDGAGEEPPKKENVKVTKHHIYQTGIYDLVSSNIGLTVSEEDKI